ncbi:hypothetical protein HD806DRAFT_175661 [Xylariaceae sp. AK1471]|nr:hypothetical protein HD806DRAFT_175661 [Xylariaceae sp. AK1471]
MAEEPVIGNPLILCAVCMKPGAAACSRCDSCYYCSNACQKTDYPAHRTLCQGFKDWNQQWPRPAANYTLAIIFPHNTLEPKLIWAPYDGVDDSGWSFWVDRTVGRTHFRAHETISMNTRLSHGFDRTLVLSSDCEAHGYSESLWRAITPYTSLNVPPCGFRILRSIGKVDGQPRLVDIRLCDLRHLIDHFYENNIDIQSAPRHIPQPFTTMLTPGCVLRSIGVTMRTRSSQLSSISALPMLAQTGPEISPISRLLGVPLQVSRLGLGREYMHGNGNNPFASYMMLVTDIDDPDFGTVPQRWSGEIGDVIIVREDGEPLEKQMLWTWVRFTLSWVSYFFAFARQEGTQAARQKALELVTCENAKNCQWMPPSPYSYGDDG